MNILLALIKKLKDNQLQLSDLLLFLFDPAPKAPAAGLRFTAFWKDHTVFERLMDYWTKSTATPTGRKLVKNWAIEYVSTLMNSEARSVTKLALFCSSSSDVTPEWVQSFSPSDLQNQLLSHCPVTSKVLQRFSTSSRQPKSNRWHIIKHTKNKVKYQLSGHNFYVCLTKFGRQYHSPSSHYYASSAFATTQRRQFLV